MSYENHPMSVFAWTFTRRYVFHHPIRILKWWLDARRQMKQRAIYGWCDNDLADWYNWSAFVLAGLLTEISDRDVIPASRAAQIKSIAANVRNAVLGDAEYKERRKMIEEAFAELGRIFFDFMS